MERLALIIAAAAIVAATGCSAGTEPADSSSVDPGPTATAAVAPTAAEGEAATAPVAAPSEALQRAVIDEVRRTLGAGSGNGPSPDDAAVLEVSVFAERDALDDDRVAAAEREVARLAAAEGFEASFVYGAFDGS